jgi:hypothetical protein
MTFMLNGIGTKYYGIRGLPDGTCITTKWFVFLLVPIIPIESVRILDAGPLHGSGLASSQSITIQKVPLDLRMVLWMYGWMIAGAVALYLFLRVMEPYR